MHERERGERHYATVIWGTFIFPPKYAGRACMRGCIQNETVAIPYHQHEWDVVLFVCVCTDSHCYDGWDRVSASWTEGSADATWDTLTCDLTGSLHLGHFISQFLWFGDLFPLCRIEFLRHSSDMLFVRRVKHTFIWKSWYCMQECIHLVNGNSRSLLKN